MRDRSWRGFRCRYWGACVVLAAGIAQVACGGSAGATSRTPPPPPPPAATHTVVLNWTASASSVTGYNVYRSQTSGGPYVRINPTPVTQTSYSDSTVQANQTYYYVTTAVDTQGVESAYSNQVTASVPN